MSDNQNTITYMEVGSQDDYYTANGTVSNVYKCKATTDDRIVAVKVVMRGMTNNLNVRRRFHHKLTKLVAEWQKLKHPNIMECYGITLNYDPFLGVILPWCNNGSIRRYIKNTRVNRLDLMAQVSSGISYMHSQGIVHTDIRARNIMIGDDGVPLIMDHGLTLLTSPLEVTLTFNFLSRIRWNAPELLEPDDDDDDTASEEEEGPDDDERSPYTTMSDVYSLAMTILEVVTEEHPYSHIRYDTAVCRTVLEGHHPRKPDNFSENLWSLLESCWNRTPQNRPTAEMVWSWLDVVRLAYTQIEK